MKNKAVSEVGLLFFNLQTEPLVISVIRVEAV